MKIDDYQCLLSEQGRSWLESAAATRERSPLVLGRWLRKRLPASQARLVAEQLDLRQRAAAKFAASERMFFTRVGLEQATDQWIAAYKAQRFASRHVLDLCCGIGGDLMALAARGPACGIDKDPVCVLLAQANCKATGVAAGAALSPIAQVERSEPPVEVGEADQIDVGTCDAWHADPDRRPSGRRTTHVGSHDPPAGVLDRLLAMNPNAAIKLAPASDIPPAWTQSECEWISRQGQCRQLVCWFGDLAHSPGRRRATLVRSEMAGATQHGSQPLVSRSLVGDPHVQTPVANEIGRYLFEPDAAVLAAGLMGCLAHEHVLSSPAAGSVYLTGDSPLHDPAMNTFEVLEAMPFDVKRVKQLLRGRGIGRLEVKTRGTRHRPEPLLRQLRVPGDEAATLILTRINRRETAVVARRVPAARDT